MKPKECFWPGLKGGIFEQKHFRAMGNALWLFGWLCMRQSQVNESGDGLPHYGNPLTFKEISDDTGFSRRTIEKWTATLTRTGYIHTKRVGNSGAIFFIYKAKSKAKAGKNHARVTPETTAKLQPELQVQVPANGRTPESQVPANEGPRPRRWAYTQGDKSCSSQAVKQNPNTLTPKHPFNYNTTADAKSASDVSYLLEKVARARELQIQRPGLRERQRLLDEQAETILDKYNPGWRKQATA